MKNVNFRNIASTIFDMLGVLFWMLGLCATSESDSMAFALVNLGLLTIGSIFIILSLKINPERAKKFLYDPEEDKPHIEEHNYSPDFEALYKQIILRRVDELIQPGEV